MQPAPEAYLPALQSKQLALLSSQYVTAPALLVEPHKAPFGTHLQTVPTPLVYLSKTADLEQ